MLERLGARQPSYRLTTEPRAFLRGIGEDPEDAQGAVRRLRAADPRLATMFEPMFGVTFTPTRISASEKINVIPSRAELRVDCRVPPGLGEQEVREGIAEVLGEEGSDGRPPFRIEFTEQVVGNRSPVQSPLMDTIAAWISEHDPGAEVGAGGPARASPTRATSGSPSRSASPTGSSPTATSRCWRRRRSSTAPTSASTCATSPSPPSSSPTSRCACWADPLAAGGCEVGRPESALDSGQPIPHNGKHTMPRMVAMLEGMRA